jgi:hypothetical protein
VALWVVGTKQSYWWIQENAASTLGGKSGRIAMRLHYIDGFQGRWQIRSTAGGQDKTQCGPTRVVNERCEGHETVMKGAGDSDLQDGEEETEPSVGET